MLRLTPGYGSVDGEIQCGEPSPERPKVSSQMLLRNTQLIGSRFGGNLTWKELDPLLEEMRGLAEKYDVPMSAIALNWVICKGAIPLGGARNAHQAEQVCSNLGSYAWVVRLMFRRTPRR